MNDGRLRHMPALDGLRGAAVAGVLLFHAGHLRGGYLGVDAFFVLSGFLITSLLLLERAYSGSIGLGAFWARRARRLLPALFAVLAFVALYAGVIASAEERASIRADALATLAYVANWRAIFTGADYWALFRSPSPLEHTWSLAIEEQFYLLWPLLVVVVAARPRRVLLLASGLGVASFAAMQLFYDPASPSRAYYGTDTRLASILIGAALAAWSVVRPPVARGKRRLLLEAAAVGAVGLLGYAWTRLDGSSAVLYRGGLLATALAVAIVIAAAVHPVPGPVGRALSWRPLCALGLISYGAYLWHWPIYVWLDDTRTGLTGWPLVALRIGTTIGVATISYVVVEQPIRRGALSPRVLRPVVPAVAVALIAGLMLATSSVARREQLAPDPIRVATPPTEVLPSGSMALAASVATVLAAAISASTTTAPQPTPPPAPPTGPQRLLVVGNSVALYLGDEGFKALRTEPALDVLNRGEAGCAIVETSRTRSANGELIDLPATYCRADWDEAASAFQPDLVVLSFAEPTDSESEVDGRWTAPCDPFYDARLEAELRGSVQLFVAGGARVLVTTAAYANLPGKSGAWFAHNDCQNDVIRRVVASEAGALLADVFAWICPERGLECRNEENGQTLRLDAVHFRNEGAAIIASRILEVAGIATVAP